MKLFSARAIGAIFAAGLLFVLPLFFLRSFDEQFLEPKRVLMEVLLFAGLFVAIAADIRRGFSLPRSSRAVILRAIALCGAVLISCAQNPAREFALMESLGFICGPLWLVILLCTNAGEPGIAWIFRAIAFAATIVAAITLLQWSGHDPLLFGGAGIEWNSMVPRMRMYSTLGNPNLAASYLAAAMFPVFALAANAASRIARITWRILGLAIIAAILGCGSRGAWIGLGAGATIMLVLFARRGQFSIATIRSSMPVAVAPILIPASILIPPIISAALERVGGRIYMWRVALPLFVQHPFLGSGWGSVSLRFLDLQAAFLVRHPQMAVHWSNPAQLHNDPLQFLVETGLVGFAIAGILFWIFAGRVRNAISESSAQNFIWVAASAGGASAIFIGSIFNFQMANAAVLILFFTFVAIPFLARDEAATNKTVRRISFSGAAARSAALILCGVLLWRTVEIARADMKYAVAVRAEDSDAGGAARLYREAAELAPWNGLIHFGLARTLYVEDQDEEALREATIAGKSYSDSHLEVLIARILQDMHRGAEAAEHYTRARNLDPALPNEL